MEEPHPAHDAPSRPSCSTPEFARPQILQVKSNSPPYTIFVAQAFLPVLVCEKTSRNKTNTGKNACATSLPTILQDDAGHPQIGRIDHFAVQGRRAPSRARRLFVGPHHLFGLLHLLRGRAEDGVDGSKLARVNALLAIEAQCPRDAAGALKAGGILVCGIRAVHAAQAVGPCGGDNPVHYGMPPMAGI